MITELTIYGFKSIKKLVLKLNPITLLIGSNGAGKSNLLKVFDLLQAIYHRNLQEYIALHGGEEKFLFNGSKETDKIVIKLVFDGGINGYQINLLRSQSGLLVHGEFLMYEQVSSTSITNNQQEAQVKFNTSFRAHYIQNYLESVQKYHFHDTGEKSPFNRMSHIENDVHFLYNKGENLAAYLYNIKKEDPTTYFYIVKTIQSIVPYFSDFYLKPNENGYLRLHWRSIFNDGMYGITDFSDGTLRFIALATLFLQPNPPKTIIIDEPELGLHPAALSKLAAMIKRVRIDGIQVLMSTQSTELVNHFDSDDIVIVDQKNGESQFKHVNEDELSGWLDEYQLGDLWKRNIILGGQP